MKQNFQMIRRKVSRFYYHHAVANRQMSKGATNWYNCIENAHFPVKKRSGWKWMIVVPFKWPFLNSPYFVSIVQNTNEHETGAISSSFETFGIFVSENRWLGMPV